MYVIGLMSGTSGDGVDAALVRITHRGVRLRVTPVAFVAQPFSPSLQQRILGAGLTGTVRDICHLNATVGEWFARAAQRVIAKAELSADAIGCIGSHGQTVHHLPQGIREIGLGRRGLVRSTLQIGEPSVIAERTGILTVANFRTRDVAAGGQGAPLVPAVHHLLLTHARKARLIVNLGGISNVTYLPAGGDASSVRAFDTGPANMLLDGAIHHLTRGQQTMDRDGAMAAEGRVHPALFAQLRQHPFLRRRPPKSTGREDFGEPFLLRVIANSRRLRLGLPDLLATLAQFTAHAVHCGLRWLPGDVDEVFVAGGGVHNRALMDALAQVFSPVPVRTVDEVGWSSRAFEATAFAVFAYQTLRGRPNNLPQVTGAAHPVVMGQMTPGCRPLRVRA